ncbi:MAG TPA: SRPBCC domain-containing protein [Pseudomonadales bacterium]|nr:SRPBCC domain-containing protein [Pseudomonadales bacterium]
MFDYCVRSDEVQIDAPAQLVWDILFSIDRYPEWNPFTYKVISSLNPGDDVELYVDMPGRGKILQVEQVKAVEPPNLLSWGMKMGAEFFLTALREQKISSISATRCSYITTDAFSGLLTPIVIALFGKNIRTGFNRMAYALKRKAEKHWQMIRENENVLATH